MNEWVVDSMPRFHHTGCGIADFVCKNLILCLGVADSVTASARLYIVSWNWPTFWPEYSPLQAFTLME
jgi:hypothetical protein